MPVTLSIDWEQGRRERPNCDVFAYLDGEQIGVCQSVSTGEFSRHAAISADWENYRTLIFYSNCGYRVVDWTYEYHKTL